MTEPTIELSIPIASLGVSCEYDDFESLGDLIKDAAVQALMREWDQRVSRSQPELVREIERVAEEQFKAEIRPRMRAAVEAAAQDAWGLSTDQEFDAYVVGQLRRHMKAQVEVEKQNISARVRYLACEESGQP